MEYPRITARDVVTKSTFNSDSTVSWLCAITSIEKSALIVDALSCFTGADVDRATSTNVICPGSTPPTFGPVYVRGSYE